MRRLPPLGAIQAFVHVARLGSLKSAADALALSSPALTRRIQGLEQFLGHSLFERHRNGIALNPQGKGFLADVAPHLDSLAAAVERNGTTGRTMQLRIAVPSLFASQRLMPALPSLAERDPNLQLEIDTNGQRDPGLNDGIDAAIVIAREVDARLYSRVVQRGRIHSVGSREAKRALASPAQLTEATVLLHREMPTHFSEWSAAVGLPDLQPKATTYFDSGQLLLDAAANGLGIGFMFESHLRSASDPRLVQVFDQTAASPYAYWFACTPGALARRPVRLFHDWLFENVAGALI